MIQSLPTLRQQFLAENKTIHDLSRDDPRAARPLSLEHTKKQAKDLLQVLRRSQSWEHVTAQHPRAEKLTPETVKLSDAQRIVALEHGFLSWPRLKHHVDAAEFSRRALESGQPTALDADRKTLHVRCGNDVMYKLAVAGFTGDFLVFADPYIQGPVPDLPDLDAFVRARASFIAGNNWRDRDQAYAELADAYQALEKARSYERVAFWLEHDAYDVLVLIKLLHFFSDAEKRARDMRYLCASSYPGVNRFNGIGQLPAEAMRVLWDQFRPIGEEQFEYGRLCWEAYIAPTPEAFCQLAMLDNPPLPEIVPALKRHLQELPWRKDGLNLSERLTLKILADQGPQNAARLYFHWYTVVYEPLVFMGDISYWVVLDQLSRADQPAITVQESSEKRIDWHVSLTDFGRSILYGDEHWMKHNAYDRWWGGVHNQTGQTLWQWDDELQQVVPHTCCWR